MTTGITLRITRSGFITPMELIPTPLFAVPYAAPRSARDRTHVTHTCARARACGASARAGGPRGAAANTRARASARAPKHKHHPRAAPSRTREHERSGHAHEPEERRRRGADGRHEIGGAHDFRVRGLRATRTNSLSMRARDAHHRECMRRTCARTPSRPAPPRARSTQHSTPRHPSNARRAAVGAALPPHISTRARAHAPAADAKHNREDPDGDSNKTNFRKRSRRHVVASAIMLRPLALLFFVTFLRAGANGAVTIAASDPRFVQRLGRTAVGASGGVIMVRGGSVRCWAVRGPSSVRSRLPSLVRSRIWGVASL